MDVLLLLKAALLGVVEGLTEFLPISSTGHLILAASLLDFTGNAAKVFEIAIQTGAMFAVMWEYRTRLAQTLGGMGRKPEATRLVRNLIVAFIPAAVAGLALGSAIKARLFHPVPVALSFVAGGIIILWVERRYRDVFGVGEAGARQRARVESVDEMSTLDAFKVGLVQCAALIPGTSRSGATIIGAMLFGFSRKTATEFSFFLGIPTLIAAGAYSLLKERANLHLADLPMFLVGLVTAFISALLCIRWLIRYVSTHDFTVFAWYRIVFGGLVLLTAWTGLVEWKA